MVLHFSCVYKSMRIIWKDARITDNNKYLWGGGAGIKIELVFWKDFSFSYSIEYIYYLSD